MQSPEINDSIRLKVNSVVKKIHRTDKGEPRILFYSPESRNDRGYLHYVVLFEHLSRNYKVVTSCETKEEIASFDSVLETSEYLVVLSIDNSLCMKPVIPEGASPGIYKVIKNESKPTLKKIE